MVVYTRARVDIRYLSDNWHESQWDTMIKWLIPMHSLNDCEISMFTTTTRRSFVCERKKWKKKIKPTSKSWNRILMIFYDTHTYNAYHTHTHACTVSGVTSFLPHIKHIFYKLTVHRRNSFLFNHLSTATLLACPYFQQQHVVFGVLFCRFCALNWKHNITIFVFFFIAEGKNPKQTNKILYICIN